MGKEFNNSVQFQEKKTFGNPVFYLRLEDKENDSDVVYEEIKKTLNAAFDEDNKDSLLGQLSRKFELPRGLHTQLDFINYGNTQLVYLATLFKGDFNRHFTVLVNQPSTKLETVKDEFDNLQTLFKIDPRFVIEPHAFFTDGKYSLYATTYIEKARCIYSGYGRWGMFDPKPIYHFVPFSQEVSNSVTSNMVALLVRYYNEKRGVGISRTQLNGDDFILSQEWNQNSPNAVLENMKLISARGTVDISFNEYLDILRNEFMRGTHYKDDIVRRGEMRVNFKSGLPMSEKVIEDGIILGLSLRN